MDTAADAMDLGSLSSATAEATAGEARDLDGLSTAAPPRATTHGPAAEALLEGTKYDAVTEDVAGSSEAAAAAGVRPPRRSNWGATIKKQKKKWKQHGGRPR